MSVNTTINFKWEFKKRKRPAASSYDVTISRVKNGIKIHFRNGKHEFFMPESYVIFGIENNLLGFMKSDTVRGFKLHKPVNKTMKSYWFEVKEPDLVTKLSPFIGSYDLECNEVNQLYVNRRNVK